jgi:hypothetical protein
MRPQRDKKAVASIACYPPVLRTVGRPRALAHSHGRQQLFQERSREGCAPDFDVFDTAAWSAVSALSEKSVADRSRPVDFPDFTKGKWKTNPPVRILGV